MSCSSAKPSGNPTTGMTIEHLGERTWSTKLLVAGIACQLGTNEAGSSLSWLVTRRSSGVQPPRDGRGPRLTHNANRWPLRSWENRLLRSPEQPMYGATLL
jgi:hypothetical protein